MRWTLYSGIWKHSKFMETSTCLNLDILDSLLNPYQISSPENPLYYLDLVHSSYKFYTRHRMQKMFRKLYILLICKPGISHHSTILWVEWEKIYIYSVGPAEIDPIKITFSCFFPQEAFCICDWLIFRFSEPFTSREIFSNKTCNFN